MKLKELLNYLNNEIHKDPEISNMEILYMDIDGNYDIHITKDGDKLKIIN